MFEEFINRHVRILKRDGYTKYGTVLAVDSNFIKLCFDDGRVEFINFSEIGTIAMYNSGEGRA